MQAQRSKLEGWKGGLADVSVRGDAFVEFTSPDPIAWYFGKRALGVDYRDDYGRLLNANLG